MGKTGPRLPCGDEEIDAGCECGSNWIVTSDPFVNYRADFVSQKFPKLAGPTSCTCIKGSTEDMEPL